VNGYLSPCGCALLAPTPVRLRRVRLLLVTACNEICVPARHAERPRAGRGRLEVRVNPEAKTDRQTHTRRKKKVYLLDTREDLGRDVVG